MNDQLSCGNGALARNQHAEAIRHWMAGLDAGDARCGAAIAEYLQDSVCVPGGSWEAIRHYLTMDLSAAEEDAQFALKYVGTEAVPLPVTDWSSFSFALDDGLANPSEPPPPIWQTLQDFLHDRNVTSATIGQYEVGFWPTPRLAALSDTQCPLAILMAATASGDGLRICTLLSTGPEVGFRPSQRWFAESLFRLGEDVSRKDAAHSPFTIGDLLGRAGQFSSNDAIQNPENLYATAEFLPRPTVWSGEVKWNFMPGSLQRLIHPVQGKWAGYLVPMNSDTHRLRACITGAIDSLCVMADWHNSAFYELGLVEDRLALHELIGIPGATVSHMLGNMPVCWPDELTEIFIGMDRGDPEALSAWNDLQERAATRSQPRKRGWLSWFTR